MMLLLNPVKKFRLPSFNGDTHCSRFLDKDVAGHWDLGNVRECFMTDFAGFMMTMFQASWQQYNTWSEFNYLENINNVK